MNVSHETKQKLSLYQELLLKWNNKINLIGAQSIDSIFSRHIQDSLQLMQYVDDQKKRIVDFGSGAGLPGLVLAIAGCKDVHLIESDKRKTLFMQEALRLLKIDQNVEIYNKRIENIPYLAADIITSRACADINTLLYYSYKHMKCDGYALFLKGETVQKELALAKNHAYNYELHQSVTNTKGMICKITDLKENT